MVFVESERLEVSHSHLRYSYFKVLKVALSLTPTDRWHLLATHQGPHNLSKIEILFRYGPLMMLLLLFDR